MITSLLGRQACVKIAQAGRELGIFLVKDNLAILPPPPKISLTKEITSDPKETPENYVLKSDLRKSSIVD